MQNDLARRRSGGRWTQECRQTGDGFLTQDIINVHLNRQMSCNNELNYQNSRNSIHVQVKYHRFYWFYCHNNAVQLHFSNFLQKLL